MVITDINGETIRASKNNDNTNVKTNNKYETTTDGGAKVGVSRHQDYQPFNKCQVKYITYR